MDKVHIFKALVSGLKISRTSPCDLDYSLWDHDGQYAPFASLAGNISIPLRLVAPLGQHLAKTLLQNIDYDHVHCLLLVMPEHYTAWNALYPQSNQGSAS